MTTNTGILSEFVPQKEKLAAYLESVELFFVANGIEGKKQIPVLLTATGEKRTNYFAAY